jgi:S1/P1 Nuclease
MIATLPASSGASDELRSYDLVWILHLVGDAHQPLHAVTRFTKELPSGDRGGNLELVIPATGETVALHAYWDSVFGGYSSAFGAIFDAGGQDGIANIDPNPEMVKIADPERWIEESAALAKIYAYAAPVSSGSNTTLLTREYETNARNISRSQAALAAARLADLVNNALQ